MAGLWERRSSRAARIARGLGAFSVVLFAVAVVGHRFGLVETIPFLGVLAIVGVLAVLAALFAGIAFARIWVYGHRGAGAAAAGLLLALTALAPYAVSAWRMAVYPPLSDVSTDLVDPPEMPVARRLREPGMNPIRPISQEAALLQTESYPDLVGRRYEYGRDRVASEVDALLAARGWAISGRQQREGAEQVTIIEAVARSFLLGLESDVAIRIADDEAATLVDMRAVSRYGPHDLGDNAKCIRSFLSDLDQKLANLPGQ